MEIVKRFKHIVLAMGILMAGIAIIVLLRLTAPSLEVKPVVQKIWPVTTQILKVTSLRPIIQEFGTVVAGSQAELRPLVSGRIVEVGENYFEGALIEKGQLLLKIDPFDYLVKVEDRTAALSEVLTRTDEMEGDIKYEIKLLAITRSQLAIRKRDLNRRRKLAKQGSTSRKSLDDAEVAYNKTAKDLAVRQQVILRLKNRLNQQNASAKRARSSLRLAKRDLEETTVNAPFAGFLANADISIGQTIGTNERLARLIEARRLEVKFRLSERDFSSLVRTEVSAAGIEEQTSELLGKQIKVKWNVGKQSFKYNATIQRLGAEIDVTAGGVDIYARLIDIGLKTSLRPGAFVEVLVPSRMYKNVAKVPDTAVVRGNVIYLIEQGRVKETKINQVRRGATSILIRGPKLDGSVVITRPFPKISNGLLVEAK
jgi:RND family efflux transporter MFP subunit